MFAYRMKHTAYLLLGCNLGDCLNNLLVARHKISRQVGDIITYSAIYRSAAWGKTDQPDFYNQVVKVTTSREPLDVLSEIQKIETDMGRSRIEKWGTRIIDIDLLFWDDLILNESELKIPHPGIPERRFTLVPLAELEPGMKHPVSNKTMIQLLQECKDPLWVERL